MDGRYRLVKRIGKGATAEVFLAEDCLLRRRVAVKCGHDREVLLREARLQAELAGSAFPCLYGYEEMDGLSLLFMEYIEGENLVRRRERIGSYRGGEVLRIAGLTAEALLVLHEAKSPCVYGDMKPEHILLKPDGSVRMVDLGAAVALKPDASAESGEKPGRLRRGATPHYASPETWTAPPDVRNDIYALGRLMQELLSENGIPDIPGYRGLVERCVQKRPEARFRSLREFLAAVERVQHMGAAHGG